MDDGERYLRRVAQIRRQKFGREGFVSATSLSDSESDLKRIRLENDLQSKDTFCSTVTPSRTVPKRCSLIDKWFPGNALKVSSIPLSCSPSTVYVETTVLRIVSVREKMLSLRGGVEDIDAALGRAVEVAPEQLEKLKTLIQQFVADPPSSVRETDKLIKEFKRIKSSISVPLTPNASKWHEFLTTNGPETSSLPLTSFFLFPSSSSITLLFTILTQQLLKKLRALRGRDDLLTSDCIPEVTDSQVPIIDHDLPPISGSNNELLSFMKLFMPHCSSDTDDTEVESSGFCLWLLASFSVLDTPLDPDTDRLASSLFHTCCDQIRAIGKLKNITEERRGALLDACSCTDGAKTYNSVGDVGLRELRALYSIVIVLSKVFRQNQNRLIVL